MRAATPSARGTSDTSTTITFAVDSPGAQSCDVGWTTRLVVYSDAAKSNIVGVASLDQGATSGTLRVRGLKPGTTYFPEVLLLLHLREPAQDVPPVTTLGNPTTTTSSVTPTNSPTTSAHKACIGSWKTLSAWPGGFLGEVTVRNTGTVASTSWKVAWTWSGSARISEAYNVTLGGSPTSPTLANVNWNGALKPGTSTSVLVLGTVNGSLALPSLTCTAG